VLRSLVALVERLYNGFFWVQASDFQLTHYLPAGIAVRWYFIEGRGANEIVPTFEAAKRLVEDWARGMEIEPWE
jgi:hypothetical protein